MGRSKRTSDVNAAKEDAEMHDDSVSRNTKSNRSNQSTAPNDQIIDESAVGEFEDAWEDENDDEGEVVISPDSDDEDGDMEVDDEEDAAEDEFKVYLPGQELQEDEELVVDQSTYDMLHSLTVEWPCLSFDILRDSLGPSRTMFPHTSYVVAGSQADKPKDNKIYVMKMSQLHRTKHDNGEDEDEEDDNAEDLDDDPELEYKAIPHFGGVNRIRAMPHTDSHIVASWAETGKVHIWDVSPFVSALDSTTNAAPSTNIKPLYNVDRHQKIEGYALDWSPITPGRLLSGDNARKIYLTQHTNSGGFVTESQPYIGHASSVEDIQWSSSEENVFVSAGADGYLKVWDVRTKKEAMLSVLAHDCDVNVISWHRTRQYLIASGSDSGQFSIWDLRTWQSNPTGAQSEPSASFLWHKSAITSIEWAPHDESMLIVSGADDQVTLWDLSLERDAEEEAAVQAQQQSSGAGKNEFAVPAQLLFIHQGQKNVKEVHWHRQIPGVILTTSSDGFNIFKTINS